MRASVEHIVSAQDPRLALFANVRDPELLRQHQAFIVESRNAIKTALQNPMRPLRTLLVTPNALDALAAEINPDSTEKPEIFVLAEDEMTQLAGFHVHQGALALGQRQEAHTALSFDRPGLWLALERISDPDNVGTLFRSAWAFGVQGVLLSDSCADPLYRKAIRTSLANTLRLPFEKSIKGRWHQRLEELQEQGVELIALDPNHDSLDLKDFIPTSQSAKILLIAGHEGDGLGEKTKRLCKTSLKIPMARPCDSINVAQATAIAMQRVSEFFAKDLPR